MTDNSMTRRDDCRLTIARLIATDDGRVWTKLPVKIQTQYLVLAGNVLAAVERMMTRFSWRE